MTPAQHLSPTRPAGAAADLHAVHLTALADNALALAQATGLPRRDLLLDRAQLWEQLASSSTPACAQAYRAVAGVCRQEAHLLNEGKKRLTGRSGKHPRQDSVAWIMRRQEALPT
jgi:hypothetical protein